MHRRPVPTRLLVATVLVPLLALIAGCGGSDDAGPPSDCTPVVGNKVTLVAESIQWDKSCLKVEAGSTVDFTVDNKDIGVQHDLQVFGQGSREQTKLAAGPVKQQLKFKFDNPGFYQFVCTIHANMKGDIYAE